MDNYMLQVPQRNEGVPRWAVETYTGIENDIKDWLFSHYFWELWDQMGDKANLDDVHALARANADARFKAITQTNTLRGATDTSFLLQLYEAHNTGWFRYVQEIEDVRELLDHLYCEAYETNPYSTNRYDYEFLVKTLIPTLEQLGVQKELILQIPANMGKARAGISVMRQIINEDDDNKEEKLVGILSDVCDPSLSFREFKRKNVSRMNDNRDVQKAEMRVCIAPEGNVIVLKCTPGIAAAIEHSLRGLTEESVLNDPAELLKYVTALILPKRKKHVAEQISTEVEE